MLTFLLGSLIGTLFGYCLARWIMWREREQGEVVVERKRAHWNQQLENGKTLRRLKSKGPYWRNDDVQAS